MYRLNWSRVHGSRHVPVKLATGPGMSRLNWSRGPGMSRLDWPGSRHVPVKCARGADMYRLNWSRVQACPG